jgi:hypothetical protein
VFPVRYELGFYIPEDDILHSHCRENLISYRYILVTCCCIYEADVFGKDSRNILPFTIAMIGHMVTFLHIVEEGGRIFPSFSLYP